MSRINTNIGSMNAIHKLIANNADLGTHLKRLSSGLRINSGKDDPAGLIASENLRSEIVGIKSAIDNSTRASNVIATAEGALNEISALLVDIKGILVTTANKGGLSAEEIDANQLQVDSAVNSINRIANATEFEGIKLLNGNRAYTTSGAGTTIISDLSVNSAKLVDGATMTVNVATVNSADTGVVYLSGAVSTTPMTIQVGSGRGTTELTFAAATTAAQIRTAINAVVEVTGVSAGTSGAVTVLRSRDFGADAYVSVDIVAGTQTGSGTRVMKTYAVGTTSAKDYGRDYTATVNGASAIGKGKVLTIRTAMLDAEIDLTNAAALSTATTTFYITGGGADFAIGPSVDAVGLDSIGIQSVAPSQLGNASDGFLTSLKSGGANALGSANLYTAQRILNASIEDITTLRGRLGAFQRNILDTNVNSLRITLENVTASESAIRDADFAAETAALTRAQILVKANISVLSLANTQPQSVLALLG